MKEAYNDEAIKDYHIPQKEFNGTVLMTPISRLVGVITDDKR